MVLPYNTGRGNKIAPTDAALRGINIGDNTRTQHKLDGLATQKLVWVKIGQSIYLKGKTHIV